MEVAADGRSVVLQVSRRTTLCFGLQSKLVEGAVRWATKWIY